MHVTGTVDEMMDRCFLARLTQAEGASVNGHPRATHCFIKCLHHVLRSIANISQQSQDSTK